MQWKLILSALRCVGKALPLQRKLCCCIMWCSCCFFIEDKETRQKLLLEAAVFKVVNRQKYLEITEDGEQAVEKDDVIVSLLADLQQEQDQESEKLVNEMQDKVTTGERKKRFHSEFAFRNPPVSIFPFLNHPFSFLVSDYFLNIFLLTQILPVLRVLGT